MPSVYRTPAARARRCSAHLEREAVDACARCRVALCDACSIPSPAGAACLGCARGARGVGLMARACLALLASLACAAIPIGSLALGRPPSGKGAVRALARESALRNCDDGAILLDLLHLHAARDDAAVLALARDHHAACGEHPMVLAMGYRGACGVGDAPAASAIAACLAALPPDRAPSWRGIACPPLRAP